MQELSIGEVAKTANVSVRTLRHYDAIGLLKPNSRSESGYRFYTDDDLCRLHDILTYRALGLALNEISRVLAEPSAERLKILTSQKQMIDDHIAQLTRMKKDLEKTLKQEELTMATENKFAALNGFDPDKYEQEAKENWGETEAYKISATRTKNYSKEDWARYKTEQDLLHLAMADLLRAGVDAQDDKAADIAESLRLLIDEWFYPCSKEMHAQLGEMYVMDERFTKVYDDVCVGLAAYAKQAIQANLSRTSE